MRTERILRNALIFLLLLFVPRTPFAQEMYPISARWDIFLKKFNLEVRTVWPIINHANPVAALNVIPASDSNEAVVIAQLTARDGTEYNRRIFTITPSQLIPAADDAILAVVQERIQYLHAQALLFQRQRRLATHAQIHFDPGQKTTDMAAVLNEFLQKQIFSPLQLLSPHDHVSWQIKFTLDHATTYLVIFVSSENANGTDYFPLLKYPVKDFANQKTRSIIVVEIIDQLIKYAAMNGVLSPSPNLRTIRFHHKASHPRGLFLFLRSFELTCSRPIIIKDF